MEHFYSKIQGWFSFKELYADVVAQAPNDRTSKFVEVGSWKGKSTAFMAVEIINSKKDIKFYPVDHWLGSDEEAHKKDPDVISGSLYTRFRRNLEPVLRDINPMRMTSLQASRYFTDDSVDFIFLDGGHDYESVRIDLDAWMPKLKVEGGILAGDDFNWTGVKKAIFETFGEDGIQVLGQDKGRHWIVKADALARVLDAPRRRVG